MTRHWQYSFWRWLHVLAILLSSAVATSARQPNIVFLIADDLGYGELGCQGNDQIPTPHIDGLAKRGVRFTSGYVTAAYCSASRAGLFTGKYQARFGYDDNPTGARNENPNAGLPRGERTLATQLRDLGYATSLVGKWHLGGTAWFHPNRRGFDEFFGFLHEGHFYVPPPYDGVTTMLRRRALPGAASGRWTSADGKLVLGTHMRNNEPDYDANNPILRQSQPVTETANLTDAFTREAVGFIKRNQERPFFLVVAYNAVHSPLQAADRYMERFAHIEDVHRRIFAGMLSHLDDSVGAVLEALSEAQLADDTLVFFVSDNGGPTRELTSSNAPLKGGKGQLYEGGIRVPMIARWPSRWAAGREVDASVLSIDMTVTALCAAGGEPTPEQDGVDLRPFIEGRAAGQPHGELYWRMGRKAALRQGAWKVVRNSASENAAWELYRLDQDLMEARNLAEQQPARLEQLVERWNSWNSQMAEPVRWR